MHDGRMLTYEQNITILTSEYWIRVIIDNIYTRHLMPLEIDSEIKIIPKKNLIKSILIYNNKNLEIWQNKIKLYF